MRVLEYGYDDADFKVCQYSIKLLKKIEELNKTSENEVDIKEVKKAIYLARKYHSNQFRQSGEPYYSHVNEVACMTSDYIFSTESIIVALLHDIVEDTSMTVETLERIFGKSVAMKVLGLTRMENDTAADTVEKLWGRGEHDVLLIKLCDRMHNMSTLCNRPTEKIKKAVRETVSAFIVLAAYLGVRDIEEKLTEICFHYVQKGIIDDNEIESFI